MLGVCTWRIYLYFFRNPRDLWPKIETAGSEWKVNGFSRAFRMKYVRIIRYYNNAFRNGRKQANE